MMTIGFAAMASTPAPADAQARTQDYLRDVIKLAGVLGSAHGVRYVCYGDADQYWRQHMVDLLGMEAPERGSLRESMVRAFNNSFTRTRDRFDVCDQRARSAEADFAAEGRDIADKLAASYFPRPRR